MFYTVTGGTHEMDKEIWLKHYFETKATISISKCGYVRFWYQRRYHFLHRWIMNAKPGEEVSHLDGNKLNNKRSNLKICSRSENFRNLNDKLRKDNPSGYRCVSWHKVTQKWQARISIEGKETYLGLFDTVKEAHTAFQRVAERFGYVPKVAT